MVSLVIELLVLALESDILAIGSLSNSQFWSETRRASSILWISEPDNLALCLFSDTIEESNSNWNTCRVKCFDRVYIYHVLIAHMSVKEPRAMDHEVYYLYDLSELAVMPPRT